jgi:hypothetical protein
LGRRATEKNNIIDTGDYVTHFHVDAEQNLYIPNIYHEKVLAFQNIIFLCVDAFMVFVPCVQEIMYFGR